MDRAALLLSLSFLLSLNSYGIAYAQSAGFQSEPAHQESFADAVDRLKSDLLLGDNHTSNSTVQSLIDALVSRASTSAQRCDAADSLGKLKLQANPALTPMISMFRSESDLAVQSAIAVALVQINPDTAIPQLLPGIESENEDFHQVCVAAICSGGKEVVPKLQKALSCPDPNIKRLAAKALGELGSTAIGSVQSLKQLSSHSDADDLFAKQAGLSAQIIKNDHDEKVGPDIAFDEQKWRDETGRKYRFRMVHDLLDSKSLIGLRTAQMQALLGRGVSFFKGAQWRYSLGLRGKDNLVAYRKSKTTRLANVKAERSLAAASGIVQSIDTTSGATANNTNVSFPRKASFVVDESGEQYLVVNVKNDIVTDCELIACEPSSWNIADLDTANATQSQQSNLHAEIQYDLIPSRQNNLPILTRVRNALSSIR